MRLDRSPVRERMDRAGGLSGAGQFECSRHPSAPTTRYRSPAHVMRIRRAATALCRWKWVAGMRGCRQDGSHHSLRQSQCTISSGEAVCGACSRDVTPRRTSRADKRRRSRSDSPGSTRSLSVWVAQYSRRIRVGRRISVLMERSSCVISFSSITSVSPGFRANVGSFMSDAACDLGLVTAIGRET